MSSYLDSNSASGDACASHRLHLALKQRHSFPLLVHTPASVAILFFVMGVFFSDFFIFGRAAGTLLGFLQLTNHSCWGD